ncbi:hypothetical protein F5Y00DRAFT_229728 [Daldinia vernicosa]|uniref:uncharacterized protein n=1 Tax=Daldinia vernicosa TaxID=114800 RepID=UPI002007821A|nr:uncharacterized protein F5Y00DRAFT_229728 [Daldinia vernicosa]KAI0851441.1 hypothetical protein F5Y00DRAFT_229728 [Daldinia vernicosa]
MPPDHEAQEPMLSVSHPPSHSPSPSPSPSPTPPSPRPDAPLPPWVRPNLQRPTSNSQRLSTPYSRSAAANDSSSEPFARRIMRASMSFSNNMLKLFYSMTLLQRIIAVSALLVVNVLLVLFLVYSHRIFAALAPVAKGWRALIGGWVIVFLMTCASGFPPMIGYSTCVTIAGFVYGFPGGWPIVASATVFGSTAAFIASRTIFSGYVHSLVGADKRFVALGQVLRRDGLLVLAAIRFCPLPFSLSNGFLATIPSISPWRFALATAMASPKLLVHVFIGSRLALLAESGDTMSAGDKAINYLSMILGSAVGITLSLFIYRRTMARARELAREEAAENGVAVDGALDEELDLGYGDLEEGRRQRAGEADEAALMDDDDISLWETDAVDGVGYRDESEEEDAAGKGNGRVSHGEHR